MTPNEPIDALGLSLESEFVPFSQSRNAKEKHLSLNWRVTLLCKTRKIVTTDYGAGMAHTPAYKAAKGNKDSVYNHTRIKTECEKGFAVQPNSEYTINRNAPILPDAKDVIYSLIQDGWAIDYPTYEGWASDLGYDEDSRKGEAIYRACLEIGLKLRASLGEAGLTTLREAFQDY